MSINNKNEQHSYRTSFCVTQKFSAVSEIYPIAMVVGSSVAWKASDKIFPNGHM